MLTLYIRPGCPYCTKVLSAAVPLGVSFAFKNVNDVGVADELIARGGKYQVPYLVDEEHKKSMYESEDIIAYLHENFTHNP